MGFSVTLYTICALIAITFIIARRYLPLFGKAELGGNVGELISLLNKDNNIHKSEALKRYDKQTST